MKKNTVKHKFIIVIIGFLIAISSIIPIRLAIARILSPFPQAVLTLGGGSQRERFTAQFATLYPNLPIWISSGSKEMMTREIFHDAGVESRRVYIDRRASDTVTNFTTLVKDFKQQKIRHIYLITDDFHLPRANAIAFIVLGSQGIAYTSLYVASDREDESKFKILRDVVRAIFWVFTKRTGASLEIKN